MCLGRARVVCCYQRATVRVNQVCAWLDKHEKRSHTRPVTRRVVIHRSSLAEAMVLRGIRAKVVAWQPVTKHNGLQRVCRRLVKNPATFSGSCVSDKTSNCTKNYFESQGNEQADQYSHSQTCAEHDTGRFFKLKQRLRSKLKLFLRAWVFQEHACSLRMSSASSQLPVTFQEWHRMKKVFEFCPAPSRQKGCSF